MTNQAFKQVLENGSSVQCEFERPRALYVGNEGSDEDLRMEALREDSQLVPI